ncbi:hypothetical protein P171DRAFT_325724, partial [Karstenula rhodostoma CBS 690.94]
NNTNSVQRNSNVLFLYGKPGYGKTTLATVVIDHLKDHISRRTNKPCSLAFFFFDRQSCFNSSHDAFRALLAQLIFSRRFDEIILDIAAIARLDHDTGQHSASNDEIFAILHLFLLQFDDCTLVCDGIDECSDREEFLTRVEDLIENDELVIPKTSTVDQTVSTIVHRANGMFLWATLFLGYLRLPSLSIAQRREALEDASHFHTTLQEYNLLEYSTRYWVAHLREFIQQLGISTYTNFGKILEESGDQATSFLSDKQRFTSWIEVLWHLGCPSEAWELKQLDWATIPTLAFATSIRTAESLLKTAYEEQHLLLQTWKHVLEKYPEEIWQPSISAFSDSKLRKRSDQATVSTILGNPTTHQESVVLQTKCSLSGDAIGILLARARA